MTDTQYKKLHKVVHKLFPFLSDDELFSKVSKADYKKFMNKLIKKYKLDDNELDEMYKIAKPKKNIRGGNPPQGGKNEKNRLEIYSKRID